MSVEPERCDLVVTRVFGAPVERVWRVWSDPELVKRWWGPDGFSCPVADMDLRVGGTSLVCMRAPATFLDGRDMYNTWTYDEIVPMERLVYVVRFADRDGNPVDPADQGLPAGMPREVRHAVTFEELPGNGTRVTVTEHDWMVGPLMEMSRKGMEQCLDKKAAIFAT
jgi:uncharacterized protein YndB with AHSA1/START domain